MALARIQLEREEGASMSQGAQLSTPFLPVVRWDQGHWNAERAACTCIAALFSTCVMASVALHSFTAPETLSLRTHQIDGRVDPQFQPSLHRLSKLFIRALVSQGIEKNICDGDDAPHKRNGLAGQLLGIAPAVPLFVMTQSDFLGQLQSG